MTTEHTPGPLAMSNAYGGGSAIWIAPNDGAKMVLQGAQCLRSDTVKYEEIGVDQLQANARRLVACWNACKGTPTESLEENGAAWYEHVIGLAKQNDELALVVKEQQAANKVMLDELKWQKEHNYNPFEHDNQCDNYKRLQAVIAKIGGAA